MEEQSLSAEEFDSKFDAGEDVSQHIAWDKARRPGHENLATTIRQLEQTKARLIEEARQIDETLKALQAR